MSPAVLTFKVVNVLLPEIVAESPEIVKVPKVLPAPAKTCPLTPDPINVALAAESVSPVVLVIFII